MSSTGYRGIGFPFRRGSTGFPVMSEEDQVIQDALYSLISTGVGERPMRNDAGVNAHAYVFENITPITQARIAQDLRRAIGDNEKRVEVMSITTRQENFGNRTGALVLVTYMVAGRTTTMEVPLPSSEQQ